VRRARPSVLYGSDAVTGVVQIFTRRGTGASRAEASVRGGTYGTLAWDAETSGGTQVASYSILDIALRERWDVCIQQSVSQHGVLGSCAGCAG